MKGIIQKKGELTRGYYRFSKAWYATDRDLAKPTVMVGLYHPDGGTAGEISIEWEDIKGQQVPQQIPFFLRCHRAQQCFLPAAQMHLVQVLGSL